MCPAIHVFSYVLLSWRYHYSTRVIKIIFYALEVIAISPIAGVGGFAVFLVVTLLTCLNSYLQETADAYVIKMDKVEEEAHPVYAGVKPCSTGKFIF